MTSPSPNPASSAAPLLDYAVSTVPAQLQASPPDGNPSYGALTIVVGDPSSTTPVLVQQIEFALPIGPDAADLSTAAAASGILATASPAAQWQIAQTAAGVFTATPQPGAETITGGGLSFRLSNILLNQQVGTAELVITEISAPAPPDAKPVPAASTTTVPLAKFPYGFAVSDLAASAPAVADGGTVTLTWAGSDGPVYTMLFGTQSADVTAVRSWTSPPLFQDTTFILRAVAQSGGAPVAESLSVTATVADPSLTVHDLTVQTTATVQGTTTLQGATTVQGAATFQGATQTGPPLENGSLGLVTVNSTTPSNQAISAHSNSQSAACGWFVNSAVPYSGVVSGVGALVSGPSALGLWTNGLIASAGSTPALAHLPTAAGPRVVTSPLSLEPEIHLSGTGRLSGGSATVPLPPDTAGALVHHDEAPIRVLLTPTAQCNGLAVTRKGTDGFDVAELAGGGSDATFDWFVIAHRSAAPDSPDRAALPARLPEPNGEVTLGGAVS